MLNLGAEKKMKYTADHTEFENGRPPWVDQPTKTHSGHPIREIPWSLPYFTQSLCPECTKVVKARKFAEDGKVWMDKTCKEHGYFKELISPDLEVYMDMFTFRFGDGQGVSNPIVPDGKRCPEDCGICNMHHSHTALANVDLTNRCDMTCPVCFANANAAGYVCEPDLVDIRRMLQNLRDMKPVPAKVVQFAGGEPTIHPQFYKICEMAKEMGFFHIQVASNGKNLSNYEFAKKSKDAGLHTIYLQFDGVSDDVQFKTRAEKIMDTKRKVVENARKVGLKVVLVPTLVQGVNDHQVGDIVRFAIENVDVIVGISFQPVCFTGRINEKNRLEKRYTMTHLALDVEKQTGLVPAKGGWLPLGCTSPFSKLSEALSGEPAMTITCHPDCGNGAYLFVEPTEKKEVRSLTDFFDLRAALVDVQALAREVREKNESNNGKTRKHLFSKAKALNILRRHYKADKAPRGLTFKRLLGVLDGYADKTVSEDSNHHSKHAYPTLFVAGMHFQDPYNYDIERVKRCIIHYSARDGRIYPFCTYNSGPYYRERVEESISVSLGMYKNQSDLGQFPSQVNETQAMSERSGQALPQS
ncbi:MAG: radical SAM protein [Bdellovibrionales bacterium]|nr:radical SAM protein [Bdellovibrionales bacterium]